MKRFIEGLEAPHGLWVVPKAVAESMTKAY